MEDHQQSPLVALSVKSETISSHPSLPYQLNRRPSAVTPHFTTVQAKAEESPTVHQAGLSLRRVVLAMSHKLLDVSVLRPFPETLNQKLWIEL